MTDTIKPRLKTNVPVWQDEDVVYIGRTGNTVAVEDPTGAIWYLFQHMDGNRTIAELLALVQEKYPDVTSEDFNDALAQFDQARFLENAAFTPDGLFDEYYLDRWDRNFDTLSAFTSMYESKYELQYRIKTARVALLGLGGLGSHLLYDLAAMGVEDIRVVEYDQLALSNLNRQILYDEADVGQLKSELAAKRIRAFSPSVRLEVVNLRMSSVEDVIGVVADRDYVISAADRPEMHIIRWVNEACVRQGTPLFTGGLDRVRSLYWSVIPGVTGCIECWRQQVRQNGSVAAQLLDRPDRPNNGVAPAFVPFVSTVTGLILTDFAFVVTGIAAPKSAGKLVEVRYETGEILEVERWERFADCPVCRGAVPQAQPALRELSSAA
jgi:molybdopterin/thiamine biosynthesis adenylyltransferase